MLNFCSNIFGRLGIILFHIEINNDKRNNIKKACLKSNAKDMKCYTE